MAESAENSATSTDQTHTSVQLIKDIIHSNAELQSEIDVFELYYSRLDPQSVKKTTQMKTETQLLTMGQKCNVVQNVHKQMSEDLKREKARSEQEMENYKATMEEAEIHLAEINKEQTQFSSDIREVLQDKKKAMMSSEKIIRCIEDNIRTKENQTEKSQLMNTGLLVQQKKLKIQLKQQEEMGEGLTALDFEQLKFENTKARKRLDEINLTSLDLKLLVGKTLQTLNSKKEKLQTLMRESDVLRSDIALRLKLQVKIEEETKQVEEERNKVEALNRKSRAQLADFQAPDALQYIKLKESHDQLQKIVREWERKVEIAEMALKTYIKSWDKIRIAAGVRPVPTQREFANADFYGM